MHKSERCDYLHTRISIQYDTTCYMLKSRVEHRVPSISMRCFSMHRINDEKSFQIFIILLDNLIGQTGARHLVNIMEIKYLCYYFELL